VSAARVPNVRTAQPGALRYAWSLRRTQGVSLPEVLVGAAVGSLVLLAALGIVGAHLVAQQRTHLALQLDQELRSAAAFLTRGLRRTAFWWDAPAFQPNPYAAWSVQGSGSAAMVLTAHAHPARAEDGLLTGDEQHGFRLRSGVLETQLGAGNWQALTDPRLTRITRLELVPRTELACESARVVRSLELLLQAQSVADPTVQRQWRSTVRLRNDTAGAPCLTAAEGTNPAETP
jgi:prepilin peptidase dependent protein B